MSNNATSLVSQNYYKMRDRF